MLEASDPIVPPETRLVLLSAAGSWADPQILELLQRTLRWPAVLARARREGATPILQRRLRALGFAGVPAASAGGFRHLAEVREFRMALLEDRLATLLGALAERRIPAVLLKGAAIASGLPGGFRDRPMGDLDVLVPEEAAAGVHELALTIGWAMPERRLSPEMYRDLHHLLPLDAADGMGFGLEIHTDIFPDWNPFRFSALDVWRDSEAVARPGWEGKVLVPSLHHQFLHTCLHFAWSHCFARGTWRMIGDLDILLSDPRFDPAMAAVVAVQSRGATCVYWTLEVVRALTGRDVPEELMEGLGIDPPRAQKTVLLRHLTREALGDGGTPGTRRLRRSLWSAAIRPRRSGHGPGRPWTGSERWEAVVDPFGLNRADQSGLGARLRGFWGYTTEVLLGRAPG
jgi:hypothetical protein